MFDFWKWLVGASLRGIVRIPKGIVRLSRGIVKHLKRVRKPRNIIEWMGMGYLIIILSVVISVFLDLVLGISFYIAPLIGILIFFLMLAYGYYIENILRE